MNVFEAVVIFNNGTKKKYDVVCRGGTGDALIELLRSEMFDRNSVFSFSISKK